MPRSSRATRSSDRAPPRSTRGARSPRSSAGRLSPRLSAGSLSPRLSAGSRSPRVSAGSRSPRPTTMAQKLQECDEGLGLMDMFTTANLILSCVGHPSHPSLTISREGRDRYKAVSAIQSYQMSGPKVAMHVLCSHYLQAAPSAVTISFVQTPYVASQRSLPVNAIIGDYITPGVDEYQAFQLWTQDQHRKEESLRRKNINLPGWLASQNVNKRNATNNSLSINKEDVKNIVLQNIPSNAKTALYIVSNVKNGKIHGVYDPESLYEWMHVQGHKNSPLTRAQITRIRRVPKHIMLAIQQQQNSL